MDIIYRKGTSGDQAAIETLFTEMLRSIYHTDQVDGYDEGYLDRFFGGTNDCVFVAQREQDVIGYLSIVANPYGESYAYLDDFCVKEEFRGLGIGTELLHLAEEHIRTIKIDEVRLHVESINSSARKLYERNGYELLQADGSRFLMKKTLA